MNLSKQFRRFAKYLTNKELSEYYGVSERSIRRWKKQGLPLRGVNANKSSAITKDLAKKSKGKRKSGIKKALETGARYEGKGGKYVIRQAIDKEVFDDFEKVRSVIETLTIEIWPNITETRYVYFIAKIEQIISIIDEDTGDEIETSKIHYISSKSFIITDMRSAFNDLENKLKKLDENEPYRDDLGDSEILDIKWIIHYIELHVGKNLDED